MEPPSVPALGFDHSGSQEASDSPRYPVARNAYKFNEVVACVGSSQALDVTENPTRPLMPPTYITRDHDQDAVQRAKEGETIRPGTLLNGNTPSTLEPPNAEEAMTTNMRDIAPPVANLPMCHSPLSVNDSGNPKSDSEPQISPVQEISPDDTGICYNMVKPTCSLNLICYRSGAKGCKLGKVQCILRSRFPDDESFEKAVRADEHLVYNDDLFFSETRRLYNSEMCGVLQRYLSLKTLRSFRILAVSTKTQSIHLLYRQDLVMS